MQTCFYKKRAGLILTTSAAGAYNAFPEKTIPALALSAKAAEFTPGFGTASISTIPAAFP